MRLYEDKVKQKWKQKEYELRKEASDQCTRFVEGERKELKYQLKELEARYQSQLSEQYQKTRADKEAIENDVKQHYERIMEGMRGEIEELKHIRERHVQVESELNRKEQSQLAFLERELKELKDENDYLREKLVSETTISTGGRRKEYDSSCKVCQSLMEANEKLIEKLRKAE